MNTKVDFVKGHCGWDTVTLLLEDQISQAQKLDSAIKILSAPINGGLEVGFMGLTDKPDEIRLRMVNSTTKNWIPMCGGMTQIIGKALVETSFRDYFKVDTSQHNLTVKLITESGIIPIKIDVQNGCVSRVTTIMDNYLAYLYSQGIEPLTLCNIDLLRVGEYAVISLMALEKQHPDLDFTRRDSGPHLDIVNNILRAFMQQQGLSGVNGMLYDHRPEGPGQFRVFPRFYSDDLSAATIPWEFQCGTGAVAVALAIVQDEQQFSISNDELLFEWGSYRTTPDPYGIRTSRLSITRENSHVTKVSFSHSVVEIIAEGVLTLPNY